MLFRSLLSLVFVIAAPTVLAVDQTSSMEAGYVAFCDRDSFTKVAKPLYLKDPSGVPDSLQVYSSQEESISGCNRSDKDTQNDKSNSNIVLCCITVPKACDAHSQSSQLLKKSVLIQASIKCNISNDSKPTSY